jgi:sulfate permease, SulP family
MRKILSLPKNYSRHDFMRDLAAGSLVGIVALPLCIAFAIASGVTPEKGIITGVIAGLLVALFSGSRVQIAGPSGPFVVVALMIVQQQGINGLIIATFSAGVILIIMGRARLGSLIKFIPYPVIAGFTAGIAINILTTELKDLFGLTLPHSGGSIVDQWITFGANIGTVNWPALAVAAGTIIIMVVQARFFRKLPGALIALICATLAVQYFMLPVETIGSRFGTIPSSVPPPVFPKLTFDAIRNVMQPAVTIALLVAIEALLSAVVADGLTGQTHDPNKVLIAHGFANIGVSLFGGLPATAAIARTATNARNGARTPVGGLMHSAILLLVLIVLGSLAAYIPLASLAAILAVVAYNLFDWRSLAALFKNPKSDIAVLCTTFGLTVLVDLTTGVEVGMILAAALFIKRMSSVTEVAVVTKELAREAQTSGAAAPVMAIPAGVEIYEINGPFFFGAVYKLREALSMSSKKPKVRIIRMENVGTMDSTGLHALEDVYKLCKKEGSTFLVAGIHAQPFSALLRSGLLDTFGEVNVLASFDEALARANELVLNTKTK